MRILLTGLCAAMAMMAAGCESQPPAVSGPDPTAVALNAPKNVRPKLKPGETLPQLQCRGWLNGAPAQFASGENGLVVVDIWADWCPVVRETASALVETQRKYADRGVAWVSLTNGPQAIAETFAHDFHMTWPLGYGAALDNVAALGTFNEYVTVPGYEILPTLYLVRSDGTVLWCDGHARMNHWPPEKTREALEAEIDKHLESPLSREPEGSAEPRQALPSGLEGWGRTE